MKLGHCGGIGYIFNSSNRNRDFCSYYYSIPLAPFLELGALNHDMAAGELRVDILNTSMNIQIKLIYTNIFFDCSVRWHPLWRLSGKSPVLLVAIIWLL